LRFRYGDLPPYDDEDEKINGKDRRPSSSQRYGAFNDEKILDDDDDGNDESLISSKFVNPWFSFLNDSFEPVAFMGNEKNGKNLEHIYFVFVHFYYCTFVHSYFYYNYH
jgi:hypothetical protein